MVLKWHTELLRTGIALSGQASIWENLRSPICVEPLIDNPDFINYAVKRVTHDALKKSIPVISSTSIQVFSGIY